MHARKQQIRKEQVSQQLLAEKKGVRGDE